MNHLELFIEHVGIKGTTAAQMGPSGHGNTGVAGGFTGPVAFAAQNVISGNIPPTTQDEDEDDTLPEYPKAKQQQSFINDVKGKNRKRAEDDLFGKAKRRVGKLTAHMKKGSDKGMFTDEKERLARPKGEGGTIKSFLDFNKD